MHKITILICGIAFILSGCSLDMYQPASPNIPILDTSYVCNVELAVTPSTGFEFKSNVEILKYGIISGTYNASGKFHQSEAAAGLQCQFNWLYLSVLGGYGTGNCEFQEGDGGSTYDLYGSSKYSKYFIQPLIAFSIDENNKLGFLYKWTSMNYAVTDINYIYSGEIPLFKYYDSNSYETYIFYRHYYKSDLAVTCYLGVHSFTSSMPLDFGRASLANGGSIGISLGYYFRKHKNYQTSPEL